MEDAIIFDAVQKIYRISDVKHDSIRNRVFTLFQKSKKREIIAVDQTSFKIKKGEIFGIVGRNGSGKSTLLKLIMASIKPEKGGKITTYGKLIRLSLAMGFDQNLSGRENIYVNGSVLGLSLKQIGNKFNQIVEFSELENFIDTKVKFYSSGMRARLAFAVAMHAEADIFLFDEFFGGVGDLRFKAKSDKIFKSTFLKDKTVVIVSHSMKTITDYCTRAMCLDKGKVICIGETDEVIDAYRKIIKNK